MATTSRKAHWEKMVPALAVSVALSSTVISACAVIGGGSGKRLERAQTKVFKASFDEVFPSVVEVLSRDYTLTSVEPDKGTIETAPKQDVELNTGAFQGVYNIKIKAEVYSLDGNQTGVRLRVLAGRMLDFVENRWEYEDFGSPQYYRDYFRIIDKAVSERKAIH